MKTLSTKKHYLLAERGFCVEVLLSCYIFLVGACVGSFVNVAALRSAQGRSFVKGRSACPSCGTALRGWELIPLVSWLLLRGKCHTCHTRISIRYPLTEAALGGAFLLCWLRFGLSLDTLSTCLLAALLLCVFLIDLEALIIPNGLILCFLAPAVLEILAHGLENIWGRLLGAVIVSLPLLLLTLLIPDCFGGGDIKLLIVCGFILGWQATLLAAFIAIVTCGVTAGILLALKKVSRRDHIAFGPWLAVGIFAARLFYEPLLAAYLSLFYF